MRQNNRRKEGPNHRREGTRWFPPWGQTKGARNAMGQARVAASNTKLLEAVSEQGSKLAHLHALKLQPPNAAWRPTRAAASWVGLMHLLRLRETKEWRYFGCKYRHVHRRLGSMLQQALTPTDWRLISAFWLTRAGYRGQLARVRVTLIARPTLQGPAVAPCRSSFPG